MYFCAGLASFEKILHGKSTVAVLVLLLAISLAPWFMVWYQPPGHDPHTVKTPSLPAIPAAFTGRSEQIQRLIHYVVTEHISIVAVTGGPGYGKSSVAIVSSHELVKLGIPVYYVSLSEVKSIEAFVMTFMQAVGRKMNEQMPRKGEFLSWTSSLDFKTIFVLDNADLLTLMRTDLRNDFLQLLKDATARSSSIHFVVATRYRFKYANDFAEIHLSALDSADAIALLRCVVLPSKQTSGKMDGSLKDEHLISIANRTGGIPLALKVVGELVKSGIVSTAEVLDELAMDPVDALSRESFPPDEQLKRCFSLSYKYLSQIMRECLIYASRFPGTFDRHARDAIITIITDDAHCLDQLVDRSLVEYSSVVERYTMHALLRTFVANSVEERPPKRKYFRLFCSHYIHLLSVCITKAKTGGEVDQLYSTITVDYHNFVHVLLVYTNESTRGQQPFVVHSEMLLFANQAFDVMKSSFPWELLLDWWTVLLKNICIRVTASEFERLAPQFLQLSTKIGNLLLFHKQYQLAESVLLFTDHCISGDVTLDFYFAICQHAQADSYTAMLQTLMKVYEKDGLVNKAHEVRERLHYCIDSAPDKEPEDLISDDFCSVGIAYLQEKHSQSRDFDSALQLFDANFKCFGFLDEGVGNWIRMLEDAYDYQLSLHPHLARVLCIARRCYMVKNYKKEAEWLITAVKSMEFTPHKGNDFILFDLHFRLARLHWFAYNNAEKAIEHGKTAYSLAIKYTHIHVNIWAASLRLADMLHQVDGRESEAGIYFEEALKHLPFVTMDQGTLYAYQRFAELHLISIRFNAGEHMQCAKHYGQWAHLEATSGLEQARMIINKLYEQLSTDHSESCSLAMVDSYLNGILGQSNMARRFLDAFIRKAQYSAFYYSMAVFSIIIFGGLLCILIALTCCTCTVCACCTCTVCVTLLFTRIAYFIFLSHFCFHYFLYYAMTRKRVWAPRQLPHIHPAIDCFYGIALFLCTVCAAIVAIGIFGTFGYFATFQVVNVYSPHLYYNMSMRISDEVIYNSDYYLILSDDCH